MEVNCALVILPRFNLYGGGAAQLLISISLHLHPIFYACGYLLKCSSGHLLLSLLHVVYYVLCDGHRCFCLSHFFEDTLFKKRFSPLR